MDNQITKNYQNYNNDEIDLYDIVEIIVRNIKIVILTTILISLISLIMALYIKNNTNDYIVKKILIKENSTKLEGVNKIVPEDILLNNKNIEEFYKIKELKEEYLLEINNDNLAERKKFLTENIKLENKNERYNIKIEDKKNRNWEKQAIDLYIKKVQEQSKYLEILEKNKKKILENIDNSKKKLIEKEEMINDLFIKDEAIKKMLDTTEQMDYIKFKYPSIVIEKEQELELQSQYLKKYLELENINPINELEIISDFYIIETKNKTKLILVIGIVMGLFLGIMMAFVKEFIDGYKRRGKKGL